MAFGRCNYTCNTDLLHFITESSIWRWMNSLWKFRFIPWCWWLNRSVSTSWSSDWLGIHSLLICHIRLSLSGFSDLWSPLLILLVNIIRANRSWLNFLAIRHKSAFIIILYKLFSLFLGLPISFLDWPLSCPLLKWLIDFLVCALSSRIHTHVCSSWTHLISPLGWLQSICLFIIIVCICRNSLFLSLSFGASWRAFVSIFGKVCCRCGLLCIHSLSMIIAIWWNFIFLHSSDWFLWFLISFRRHLILRWFSSYLLVLAFID